MPSPGGLPEVPCANCGRRVRGLRWGDALPRVPCRAGGRARRLASRIALGGDGADGGCTWSFGCPADPTVADLWRASPCAATYLLVRRIASRIAMELLPQ